MFRYIDTGLSAQTLVGEWRLAATNLPEWLDGKRRNPRVEVLPASAKGANFTIVKHFLTPRGQTKTLTTVAEDINGALVCRNSVLGNLFPTRWQPIGLTPDGRVAAIRIMSQQRARNGFVVLCDPLLGPSELRSTVSQLAAQLGLTAEDYATLAWLGDDVQP